MYRQKGWSRGPSGLPWTRGRSSCSQFCGALAPGVLPTTGRWSCCGGSGMPTAGRGLGESPPRWGGCGSVGTWRSTCFATEHSRLAAVTVAITAPPGATDPGDMPRRRQDPPPEQARPSLPAPCLGAALQSAEEVEVYELYHVALADGLISLTKEGVGMPTAGRGLGESPPRWGGCGSVGTWRSTCFATEHSRSAAVTVTITAPPGTTVLGE